MKNETITVSIIGGCIAGILACKVLHVGLELVSPLTIPLIIAIIIVFPIIATYIEMKEEKKRC